MTGARHVGRFTHAVKLPPHHHEDSPGFFAHIPPLITPAGAPPLYLTTIWLKRYHWIAITCPWCVVPDHWSWTWALTYMVGVLTPAQSNIGCPFVWFRLLIIIRSVKNYSSVGRTYNLKRGLLPVDFGTLDIKTSLANEFQLLAECRVVLSSLIFSAFSTHLSRACPLEGTGRPTPAPLESQTVTLGDLHIVKSVIIIQRFN